MVHIPNNYKQCEKLVCKECAELRTKCLELRRFGGHAFGHCPIREPKGLHSMVPKRPGPE